MTAKKAAAAKPKPARKTALTGAEQVDAFMAALDHPFKAEAQVVRDIIKGVHPGITEEVKWKAPSFSYADGCGGGMSLAFVAVLPHCAGPRQAAVSQWTTSAY